jgi:hypothetical protein
MIIHLNFNKLIIKIKVIMIELEWLLKEILKRKIKLLLKIIIIQKYNPYSQNHLLVIMRKDENLKSYKGNMS